MNTEPLKPRNGWRTDRPEPGVPVLVITTNGSTGVCQWVDLDQDRGAWYVVKTTGDPIVAWHPLPTPPGDNK